MPMLIYNIPLVEYRYEEDSNPLLVEHISMLQDLSCRSLANVGDVILENVQNILVIQN